ncbi:MAG: SpoIIE family protein phosphatase, partial [Clostridia bacterium]|nr:SpoIIE family protein phosphatase [Clostridia bacterium]
AYCGIRGGDMLVMLSDGVTDAFASSSDFIEFLKTAPQKNPQTLADSIIDRALGLCSGVAADDMTALCVRLYDVKTD